MNMNYITDYNSLIDAEKATGAKSNGIQMCCVGSYKSSGGFIWSVKENTEVFSFCDEFELKIF